MKTDSHDRIAVFIRIFLVLLGMNILINLPDEVYSAIRSRNLFQNLIDPGLGALYVGLTKIGLCALAFSLARIASRLILWNLASPINNDILSKEDLASLLYFGFAMYFFWQGINEGIGVLIVGFQEKTSWNPFSGSFPSPFYDLVKALISFAVMLILLFKKSWLPGIKK